MNLINNAPTKVLNLYAGLGGNRKLWKNVAVTAVEKDEEIAAIYKEYFPEDTVIIADAHDYLLKHANEYQFVWGSPPCPTHSRARQWASSGGRYPVQYPDMKLYQEILFLKYFYKGKYVLENVVPYYTPLIPPSAKLDRHIFWCNFWIRQFKVENISPWDITSSTQAHGFDVSTRKLKHRKDQLIRNLVHPEIGLHIFNCSKQTQHAKLFE